MMRTSRWSVGRLWVGSLAVCALGVLGACGDGVKNEEDARRAFLGLDAHID